MDYRNKKTGAIAEWNEPFRCYSCDYKDKYHTLSAIEVEGSSDWEQVVEQAVTEPTSLKVADLVGKKVAIHCPTQDDWDKVRKIVANHKLLKIWDFKIYGSNFGLLLNEDNGFADVNKLHSYTIIPSADFIAANSPKVEEKEWRVESYLYKNQYVLSYCEGNGRYVDGINNISLNVQHISGNEKCDIHSIRLLKSGLVFTVGDKVVWDWYSDVGSKEVSKFVTITKFEIIDNKLIVFWDRAGGECDILYLENICHYTEPAPEKKPVILVTEDGVEVTENKAYIYWINKNDFSDLGRCFADGAGNHATYLLFHTPEARTAYIEHHTKRFSVADLEAMQIDYSDFDNTDMKTSEVFIIKIADLTK